MHKDLCGKFEVLISVHKCKTEPGSYLWVHKICTTLEPAISGALLVKWSKWFNFFFNCELTLKQKGNAHCKDLISAQLLKRGGKAANKCLFCALLLGGVQSKVNSTCPSVPDCP